MQFYNAKIRLKGSVLNEVFKTSLSTPEVLILRRLHGGDAVVNIEETKELPPHLHGEDAPDYDDMEERERLQVMYGVGLAALPDEQKTSVNRMFGGEYTSLMQELPERKKGVKAKNTPTGKPSKKANKPGSTKEDAEDKQSEEAII